MESTEKESVNWKTKQQKLTNLNIREKIDQKKLMDLKKLNKGSNILVIGILEGKEKDG